MLFWFCKKSGSGVFHYISKNLSFSMSQPWFPIANHISLKLQMNISVVEKSLFCLPSEHEANPAHVPLALFTGLTELWQIICSRCSEHLKLCNSNNFLAAVSGWFGAISFFGGSSCISALFLTSLSWAACRQQTQWHHTWCWVLRGGICTTSGWPTSQSI